MLWQWRVIGLLVAVSLLACLQQPVLPVPSASPPPTAQPRTPSTASILQVRWPRPAAGEPPGGAPTQPTAPVDCAKLKCVALTMDDGPVGKTASVLALLRAKHVHATFFLLGAQARAHPGIVRRMLADGNVIGNHSWNHPEFWRMSRKAIRRQLARTDAVLWKITGRRPTLVRPPFGEFNAKVRAVARQRGDALILWNVDPLDWKNHNAKTVVKRVLRQARRGSIILTHDVWPSTRHAYARIIDGLRARGFTLVTVPELLGHRLKPGRVYLHR